jgi:hypothetical protein
MARIHLFKLLSLCAIIGGCSGAELGKDSPPEPTCLSDREIRMGLLLPDVAEPCQRDTVLKSIGDADR